MQTDLTRFDLWIYDPEGQVLLYNQDIIKLLFASNFEILCLGGKKKKAIYFDMISL